MSNPSQTRKLYRPSQGRVLGGVCAGIADHFGWSRTTVRVLAALSVLIPGPQFLAYVLLWVLVPDQRKAFA